MSDLVTIIQRVALLALGALGITDPGIQTSVKAVIAAAIPLAIAAEALVKHLADAHKAATVDKSNASIVAARTNANAVVAAAAARRPQTSATLQAEIAGQAPAGVPIAGPAPQFVPAIPAPNTPAPAAPVAPPAVPAAPVAPPAPAVGVPVSAMPDPSLTVIAGRAADSGAVTQ